MEITEAVLSLKSANNIALFCHINPDCDTICSAIALKLALMKLGKKCDIYCDGEMKGSVAFVKHADFINAKTPEKKYALGVAIDCGDANRVGSYSILFSRSENTLCIDHHRQYGSFAKINYVDSTAGATAELIYQIVNTLDSTLMDVEIAELLYTAIVTDTGNFAFSNTTKRTLAIASALLEYGVKNAEISYKFFKEIPFDVFKLKAQVLPKCEFFENNKIGVMHFAREDFEATNTVVSNSSNLVNELINIDSVQIAVSITEVRANSFKVSIRTQDQVDASRIAMTFGGGGHKNAAGFVMNGYYGNVLDDILKACRDNL